MCELPQHFLLLLATTILELKLMAASKSFDACKTFVRIIWGGVRVDDCNHLEEVVHDWLNSSYICTQLQVRSTRWR